LIFVALIIKQLTEKLLAMIFAASLTVICSRKKKTNIANFGRYVDNQYPGHDKTGFYMQMYFSFEHESPMGILTSRSDPPYP